MLVFLFFFPGGQPIPQAAFRGIHTGKVALILLKLLYCFCVVVFVVVVVIVVVLWCSLLLLLLLLFLGVVFFRLCSVLVLLFVYACSYRSFCHFFLFSGVAALFDALFVRSFAYVDLSVYSVRLFHGHGVTFVHAVVFCLRVYGSLRALMFV